MNSSSLVSKAKGSLEKIYNYPYFIGVKTFLKVLPSIKSQLINKKKEASMRDKEKEQLVTQSIIDYKEALYRLAYRYTKQEQDALDVVQESIYKALASLDQLKEPEYVKTWIYRIVVNTALDYLRKNKKYVYDENIVLEEGYYDQYEDIDLKSALDQLEEPYHTIIVLRYFEDLQINEIAKVLSQNENTIKTRLYAALKKLRIQIGGKKVI